jgi:hypothetical protein
MIYACVSQDILTFRKTITTKQEINDIAIANHLQNANDDLIFSAQFSPDSILFLKTTDNMKSIDTLYQTRGTQPCISFNSIGDYHPSETEKQRIAWFRDAKFGMFMHWGLYSQTAGYWKGKPAKGLFSYLNDFDKLCSLKSSAKTVEQFLDLTHLE